MSRHPNQSRDHDEDEMSEISFSVWIGRIKKALRQEFEKLGAEHDITVTQFLVLRRLWEGDGILTSVLMKDAVSDGGTITGVLDRLEAKGLIRRERGSRDRRAVRVYLTDAGRDLEAPLTVIRNQINNGALSCLSAEERESFLRMLSRIGENLGA
jgi:DNA-binding MarR family transcriptional regulator